MLRENLRQKLCRILFDGVKFSRRIVIKVINRLTDVFTTINYRLILTLPRLDVNDRDSSVQCAEILFFIRGKGNL
jgi:hypothetical protein